MSLDQVITDASKRRPIYQVFAAVGLLIGATQVGFASASAGQPVWLTVALAVYAFLGSAGFVVAQANTDTTEPEPPVVDLDVDLDEHVGDHAA